MVAKPHPGVESQPGRSVGCFPYPVPAIDSVLFLAWSARGLTLARWLDAAEAERPALIPAEVPVLALPDAYSVSLDAYFAGERVDPSALAIDPTGTPFQRRVWDALCRIPRGRVRSYAGIANEIGSPRATRAVGMASGRNPLAVIVPCHRVVEKNSRLGGYSSGLERKRFLLALEGVDVSGEFVRPGQMSLL